LARLLLGERTTDLAGRRDVAGAGGRRPHYAQAARPERRFLGELLDLGEDLVGLRELALAVPLDEPDRALLVHDERRPAVGVPVGPVDAVVLRDGAVNVRERSEERRVGKECRLGGMQEEWSEKRKRMEKNSGKQRETSTDDY